MKMFSLPGGEEVPLTDIIRVYPPQFDKKLFWQRPLYNFRHKTECHFFELVIKPDRHVRIYSDTECLRFRILMQFIMEEDLQEILD